MRKLKAAIVASLIAAGSLIATAAPAAADTGSLTIYNDHNYSGYLYTWAISGGCSNGRQISGNILTYERQRVSSIRFLAGGRGNDACNQLLVRSASTGAWYGTCLRSFSNGFNFSQPINDNANAWNLRNNAGCHGYY